MKIKNYQESKCGVSDKPKTKRPSPLKITGQKKRSILLELKFKDGMQYLTNDTVIECFMQLYDESQKTTREIAEAFGVPEEYLKMDCKK